MWRRNCFEHVIRNEDNRSAIRENIATTPLCRLKDKESPEAAD